MNDQPTPRTDDQSVRYYDDATGTRIEYVASRFARQLERELAEAQVKLEAAQYSGIHSCHANCQRPICVLRRERDELAACLASEKITRNHIIERATETERELAEAREKLENAADRIEELWNALNKFYEVNTRFGIGGFGMMEYQKANHDARSVLFPQNAESIHPESKDVEESRDGRLDETACPPSLEAIYQRVVGACLRCDPLPACQREEDQIEPPWEVIDRIRSERDEMTLRWERVNDALFNERALADRLAHELSCLADWRDAHDIDCHYDPAPLEAWKEARR